MGLRQRALAALRANDDIYKELLKGKISQTLSVDKSDIIMLTDYDGKIFTKIDGLVLLDMGNGEFSLGKFCSYCYELVNPKSAIMSLEDLAKLISSTYPYEYYHGHRNILGGIIKVKFSLE